MELVHIGKVFSFLKLPNCVSHVAPPVAAAVPAMAGSGLYTAVDRT